MSLQAYHHRGVTLIETVIWLGFIAVMALYFADFRSGLRFDGIVQKTADGIIHIDEAVYAHYLDTGTWPADITELEAYIPNLPNIDDTNKTAGANGVGLPYAIEYTDPLGLEVKTTMLTLQQALAVAAQFPNSGVHDADTFEVVVGFPLAGLTGQLSGSGSIISILDGLVLFGTDSFDTQAECEAAGHAWVIVLDRGPGNPDDIIFCISNS